MSSSSSLSAALSHAMSGLQATQTEMGTVSNNITNASTPDYHRQKTNLSSRAIIGRTAGVQVDNITRIVDRFLERDLVNVGSQRANFEVLETFFERIQNLFGTLASDNSLSRRISQISDVLNSLVNTPSSLSEQVTISASLETVVQHIRQLSGDIQTLRHEADQRIGNSIAVINEQAALIDELNPQIFQARTAGQPAGALEDRRDGAIARLAEEIDMITFTQSGTGSVAVLVASGRTLVDRRAETLHHNLAGDLSAKLTYANGAIDGIYLGGEDITTKIGNGRLAAFISMRDQNLPDLQAQLDRLSGALSDSLNAIANTGSPFPPPHQLIGSQRFRPEDSIGTTASLLGKLRLAVLDQQGDYVDDGFGQPDFVDIDLQSLAVSHGGVLRVRDVMGAINAGLQGANARLDHEGRLVIEALRAGQGIGLDSTGKSLGGMSSGRIQHAVSIPVEAARDSLNVAFDPVEEGKKSFEIDSVPVYYEASRDSLIDLAARINRLHHLRSFRQVSDPEAVLDSASGLESGSPVGRGILTVNGVAFAYDGARDSLNDLRDRINAATVWQSKGFADSRTPLGAELAGDLVINGRTVTIEAAESLGDLVTKINTDSGFSDEGVVASLIEEEGQFRLVITDTTGRFDLAGSSAEMREGVAFASRVFEVTAGTSGGSLNLSDLDSPPVIEDVSGHLGASLWLGGAEFSLTAEVRDNRLVLSQDKSEPIILQDVNGTLIAAMGFQSEEERVPPTGSQIAVAGGWRNFGYFFGLNDLILSDYHYARYASSAFDDPQSRPAVRGVLTVMGAGFREEIAYGLTDSLADIVAAFENNPTLKAQGIEAEIFREGSGSRIRFFDQEGHNFSLIDDGDLLARLEIYPDNLGLSTSLKVEPRLAENPGLLPRGAFYHNDHIPPNRFEAVTGELDSAGIDVAFDSSRARSGDVYRLSYTAQSEEMALINLRTGQIESLDISGLLNKETEIAGRNLTGEETVEVSFPRSGIRLTLDANFDRQRDYQTLGNLQGLVGALTGAAGFDGAAAFQIASEGGLDMEGLRELANIPAYNRDNGFLTLNFESPRPGMLTLGAVPGLEFSVDGEAFAATSLRDLDDGGTHSLAIRLADSQQILGVLTLPKTRGSQGASELTLQVGGLTFGQSFRPQIGQNALASGDSSVAVAMLKPFETAIDFQRAGDLPSDKTTLQGYAANMVGISSIKAQNAQTQFSAQDVLYNTLQTEKGSISGVNINEELARVEVLQAAFNAASRLIRVSSDLLDELINIVR